MGSTASSAATAATKISVKPARTARSTSAGGDRDNHRQTRRIRKPDQILEENVRLRKKILKLEEQLTNSKLSGDETVTLRRSNEELAKEVQQLKGLLMVVDGSPTLCVRSTFSINSAQSDPSDDRLTGGRQSWAHQFSPDDSTQDHPNSSSPRRRLLSESRMNKLSKLRSLPIQDGHGLFPMNDIEAYGKGIALARTDDHREKTLENIRSYRAGKEPAKPGDEQGEENGQ
uniref:Uncharacterized protein n=1 Tax=Branchiostoma floridae TaxID=7739 RepID=C3Z4P3_BRAFL|eukprot:XP_002585996.1 hypothetical protein BRAFLDRAFT_110251 [Branchiostoma floridae]